MIRRNILRLSQGTSVYRQIHTGARIMNDILPSNQEMKSKDSWTKNQTKTKSNDTVISRVVGIAKNLQENSQPPINVSGAFTKRFVFGQTYDPFDFSNDKLDIERRIKRKNSKKGQSRDIFERTGVDPLDLYTMPEILSKFLSSTGQILPRELTGCNGKNQKKLGIAVKRARSCGLLSTVHRHSRFLPVRHM